jgi:hypothetical protein
MKEITSRNNNLHPFTDLEVKKLSGKKLACKNYMHGT